MKRNAETEYRYCTFYIGEHRFAVDILAVREINRDMVVTPARGADPMVRGLLNLRGQVVTVVDPAISLGMGPVSMTRESRLIVLKNNAELEQKGLTHLRICDDLVGLLVDAVSDVVTVQGREIHPPPAGREGAPHS
ncbi:MAG: purine-binding chemotaxis protein CheW, partial [Planctomycetes bacterium]|nr:purine-binding chemotaxis protein CheW [Planctomycetota bacterium]